MKYGRFIDERTIKTGPIKRTIQDPSEFVTYQEDIDSPFASIDLTNFAQDIKEGAILFQDRNVIYKVSSKMVTQLPFKHIEGMLHKEDKDTLNKIWEGDLKYYIPDVYFEIHFNPGYTLITEIELIYEKDIFMPILNLFNPDILERLINNLMYASPERIIKQKLSKSLPNPVCNYLVSGICYGYSLSNIDRSTPANILAEAGHICNNILSAPSNSDLLPFSHGSSVWILDGSDAKGLSMDFILRSLSNISQKISQEEYLILLRKSHCDPRHIFNKLLEVNDYSEEDVDEITDLFLRTQFDIYTIKRSRDSLIKGLENLKG